jgi:transcription elongation GreA/GreB family factor
VLVAGIVLSFGPMLGAYLWERRARQSAESAAEQARSSESFQGEKQERQVKLRGCQSRIAELEERLRFAQMRYDELRDLLTRGNHQEDLSR